MLRLGIISYLNTLPVYYAIEKGLVKLPPHVEVVRGIPSILNRMLSEDKIDMAVVSAYEYALHYRKYLILPKLCIGADNEVRSVLFFSKAPIEELTGKKVYLTKASFTSKNLMIFFFKKMGIKPLIEEFSTENGVPQNDAWGLLLIGDDALRMLAHNRYSHVYDLAHMWKKLFNTPFVFALWCVRREIYIRKKELVIDTWKTLLESKKITKMYFKDIAQEKAKELGLTEKECLEYLKVLHFDLNDRFIEGLKLYYKKMKEISLLEEEPELVFASC